MEVPSGVGLGGGGGSAENEDVVFLTECYPIEVSEESVHPLGTLGR